MLPGHKFTHNLFMLVGPEGELVFSPPGQTAQDAWAKYDEYLVEGDHCMGTGVDKAELHRRGFRAKAVRVEIFK